MELLPARRAQLYRRLAATSSNPERYAHFTALAAGPGPDATVAAALDAAATAAHARAANAAAAQFAVQAVTFRRRRTPTLWCAAASGPRSSSSWPAKWNGHWNT